MDARSAFVPNAPDLTSILTERPSSTQDESESRRSSVPPFPASITRRTLLTTAALLAIGGPKTALSQISLSKKGKGKTLVVVFLRGGADGLNMVAPYAEDAYYKLRPTLAIAKPKKQADSLLDMDGFFGMHPSMRPLYDLYKEGELAAIHACGSADTTHSHFEAMSAMERGVPAATAREDTGWVARYLTETQGQATSPLRAVAIGSTVPDSLRGATEGVTISSLFDYRLDAPADVRKSLFELYKGSDEISRAGSETLATLESIDRLNVRNYKPSSGVQYPANDIGEALRQVSALIQSDLGLEVALVDKGGWDTHVVQGGSTGQQAALLTDLSTALAAFRADLGSRMSDVCVVVLTEFGRRVYENTGLGTDHGRGGVAFVLGGGAKGGKVYGQWPGLIQLSGPGDLSVTTDYRSVLGELVNKHLQTPAPVFDTPSTAWLGLLK